MPAGSGAAASQPQGVLDRVDELLEVTYRSADLGNVDDPVGEAVYIILSRQTREVVYQRVYADLLERFQRWVDVLAASASELEAVLRPAGFGLQRAQQIRALLEAIAGANEASGVGPAAGGDLTLEHLRGLPADQVEKVLTTLPGIGPKSARCIMSYCLGIDTLAVDTHVARILDRLGLVKRSAGKVRHAEYDVVVPPGMRKRLHVNLVHHGREVCRARQPRCGECVLVSFCELGRQALAEREGEPPVVELFAGAGGLGHGFLEEGYTMAAAVELDRDAAQTYRANHRGVPVLEADVTRLSAEELLEFAPAAARPAAVVAGPPCQGYSRAGRRDPTDPRNSLYLHVTRLASELGARSIVMENVPGMSNVGGQEFLEAVRRSLRRLGGWARDWKLSAVHYGVPQRRQRVIFFAGYSDDLTDEDEEREPEPTHLPSGATGPGDVTPRLIDLLAGLPELPSGRLAEYLKLEDGSYLINGSTMFHGEGVIQKISAIPPGEGPFSYRRLREDTANTLVAGHRALPVHPTLHRTISVREAARIQGFDDGYVFCGTRGKQPLQVANAVPPPLARAVAKRHRQLLGGSLLARTGAAGAPAPGRAGPVAPAEEPVVPHADVEIRVDDPVEAPGYPSWDEATSGGLDGNWQYEYLEVGWQDVLDAYDIERERVGAALAAATTAGEFEALLDGDDLEDWELMALEGLDVGIAALVLALNAAGCLTTYSCRGHSCRAPTGWHYPRITLYANAARARLVREAALTSGCGFGASDGPLLLLWAPSVTHALHMVQELVTLQEQFEQLPPRSLGSGAHMAR